VAKAAEKATSTAKGAAEATRSTASNGAGAGKSAVKNVVVPMATAMAGTAAGVLLNRKGMFKKQPRKVLGIPMPSPNGGGLDHLAKNVGEAGKQLGKLATEVRTARERAEQVGKALK
jgi:hypothetical protein